VNLTNVITVTGTILQVVLVALLLLRGAARKFRFFFSYTVFALAAELTKFILRIGGHKFGYFYAYWATEAAYVVLGFLALYEVFRHLYRHLYYLRWVKLLLPVTSFLLLVLSLWWAGTVLGEVERPLAVLYALEFTVHLLQMGFFAAIFFVAFRFEVYEERYAFGIAAGFWISATGILATMVVRSEFGITYKNLLNFLPTGAYLLAVLIWLHAFARKQPPAYFAQFNHLYDPQGFLKRLQEWRRQIKERMKWKEHYQLISRFF
jgi:hypothetical protein